MAVAPVVALVLGGLTVKFAASDAGTPPEPPPSLAAPLPRAFEADSWWNTPLEDDAPTHPDEDKILEYLRRAPENGGGCLSLAGTGDNSWGQPVYWSQRDDPTYSVTGIGEAAPPELDALRIPDGARAADNSDGSMTVFDLDKGYVVALTDAVQDDDDTWTASGATVTYLDSNGLHVDTGLSNDPRNRGTHRGNNGAVMAVMWEEVTAGAIRHVLKVASGPEVADRWVFPMVGSDGDYQGNDPAVPPQGLRMRIEASIDIDDLGLDPHAEVIARALQRYGFYIGDSGGTTSLKVEDTVTEGRGQLWHLSADALCGLPFTDSNWDVVVEGYDPTR